VSIFFLLLHYLFNHIVFVDEPYVHVLSPDGRAAAAISTTMGGLF